MTLKIKLFFQCQKLHIFLTKKMFLRWQKTKTKVLFFFFLCVCFHSIYYFWTIPHIVQARVDLRVLCPSISISQLCRNAHIKIKFILNKLEVVGFLTIQQVTKKMVKTRFQKQGSPFLVKWNTSSVTMTFTVRNKRFFLK